MKTVYQLIAFDDNKYHNIAEASNADELHSLGKFDRGIDAHNAFLGALATNRLYEGFNYIYYIDYKKYERVKDVQNGIYCYRTESYSSEREAIRNGGHYLIHKQAEMLETIQGIGDKITHCLGSEVGYFSVQDGYLYNDGRELI